MTTPEREPRRGELWASPTGDESLVIAGLDGSRWLARPVAGADLTGWTLAQEADPGDPGYIVVPADNLALRPATGGVRGTTRILRTPDAEPQPEMAVWTKPDGTSGTIPAADLDAFARYAATLRPGEPGWKHGTIAVDAAKLPSLAGQQVASAAEIKAGLDSAARKPITVDGPAEHDAPLTATCPYCGAHNQIAEINEASQTAPLEFYRGTDNDGVYGSAPDADLNIPAVAYLCTACGRGVSVPLGITLTQ